MRMMIMHDWLDTWRGGETVLAELCRMYPDADLFSLVDFLEPADREKLDGRTARTSFLQWMPFSRRHFRSFLPLFPRAVESLDVGRYDVILSSSHAVAKGVRTRPDQLHLCYCYTPMRYAWDLRDQYLQQVGLAQGLRGAIARRVLRSIACWDRRTSSRVTDFITISHHVSERIRRCYGRTSRVIYPPVTPPRAAQASTRDTYVTVSQLVPYKRVDLVVAAFEKLRDRELVVIGEGPERARVERLAGPNVRVLGRVSDEERDRWLGRARAFVFAAEEDFGISPIEAQGAGVPVIAFARGGCVETIRGLDQAAPTGVLFPDQSVEAVVDAVRLFEANEARITPEACRRNAERFSSAYFRSELGAFVEARIEAWRARGAAA